MSSTTLVASATLLPVPSGLKEVVPRPTLGIAMQGSDL